MTVLGTVRGLTTSSSGQPILPPSAKNDLALDLNRPETATGAAIATSSKAAVATASAKAEREHPQRALERQLAHTVQTGTVLDAFKDPTAWVRSFGEGTVAVANRELSITTVNAGITMARRDVNIDLTGRFLSFDVMRDANLASLEVRLSTGTNASTNSFYVQEAVAKIEPGTWYRMTYPLAQMQISGSTTAVDADDIKAIRIAPTPTTGTDTVLRVRDLRVHQVATPPAVHFQFDDGRKDTFTVAYPILKAAGFKGGIAVEHNAIGNADRMTLDELNQVYREGWSLYGHHTVQMTQQTETQVRQHMRDSQAFLDANGFVRGNAHWIWPGGARSAVLDGIAKEFWRSARKVNAHHLFTTPFVYDRVDPSHVYIQKNISVASAKSRIDQVVACGGAVVFVFHSIVDTEIAQEDWTVAKLQELVDYAKTKGLADTNFDQLYGSFRPYTLQP